MRVIPSTSWIWDTTMRPSSSMESASARRITSYGPVTSSAWTTPGEAAHGVDDGRRLTDLRLDEDVRTDGHGTLLDGIPAEASKPYKPGYAFGPFRVPP